ncbi:MAG: type II secretion system protein GspG [Verrucomicrobiae bacterium]|nr:type II secretion system protein GspG [Verrucomicrobiae bacterium]
MSLIPVVVLMAMVTMNFLSIRNAFRGGWDQISQMINQRDMRLAAIALDEYHARNHRWPGNIPDYLQKTLPIQNRLIGSYNMSEDVWGTPYQYAFSNGEIAIKSAGPDHRFGSGDDAAFTLPMTRKEAIQP